MLSILQTIGLMAVVFAISALGAYVVTSAIRKQTSKSPLHEGDNVRLLIPGGTCRSWVTALTAKGIVIAAPTHRGEITPLRPGDKVYVQASRADGMVSFQSSVTHRDANRQELTLAYPNRVRKIDRRSEPRETITEGAIVTVDGESGVLLNLSSSGARVVTLADIQAGDTVRIQLPESDEPVEGWALECQPAALGTSMATDIRVRLQSAVGGYRTRSRKHHYSMN
ncbi:flagellar brake domain-containing protein [Kamptonema cortianum]|nr:flagellar brake domain-containing protein [Geitlerinema splendidum]MDK3158753.1 flagellar brake domain-containing protein [Kamptonema cortianum]